MTTLLISEVFPPKVGGSGRWFWEIYRRLPRESYVIAAGHDPRQDDFDRTHDLRVARMPLGMRAWGLASLEGVRGYARTIRQLRQVVRSEKVGMVHCARCLPEGVMALGLKLANGLPYACYVHGEDVSTAQASREHRFLAARVLHGASLLIANSANTGAMLLDDWGMPAERVRVLHPGVDTSQFRPAPPDPSVRSDLGWDGRLVVLTVGRLQLRKGHDQLIRALATVRKALPNVLYAIAGDGEERAALRALVEREGLGDHVQFLSEVSDERLLECYQQCDLFVLPNRQVGRDIEGFGMVLLEAQACGKPVIAGASGGTAETMRIPETGLVVPCDKPHALTDAVRDLLGDPGRRAVMGAAAREWVLEHFDWERLGGQAQALFQGPPRVGAAEVATT